MSWQKLGQNLEVATLDVNFGTYINMQKEISFFIFEEIVFPERRKNNLSDLIVIWFNF